MKANVKGFIRNIVSDIIDELIEKDLLDEDEEVKAKSIINKITESYLDCIEEE